MVMMNYLNKNIILNQECSLLALPQPPSSVCTGPAGVHSDAQGPPTLSPCPENTWRIQTPVVKKEA